MHELYFYRATIVRWIDGDTVIADWDLGNDVLLKNQTFRLYGINTPELRPKRADHPDEESRQREKTAGIAARAAAERLAPAGEPVVIETIKDRTGKFGRYLVRVHVGDVVVNDRLVAEGFAEVVDYE